MRTAAILLNWLIALLWIWRSAVAHRNLPKLPDLLNENSTTEPTPQPQIAVIVPARNEEQSIEQNLRSLLAQQGITIEILAVNDRSTDNTGEIMDRVAAEGRAQGKAIRVLHIQELPAGWMGKTHAMALAARQTTTPWLLFTDGDILFREDCLRRAISYAERATDHLVIFPSFILKSVGERMLLSTFQSLSMLSMRPWEASDPKSRESIGIGAFNLIRSHVYCSIGGFEGHPMEVLEDLKLGYQVKSHGFRQQAALGLGLIRLHWAPGALGIVRNLTKNIFAVFRFRLWSPFLAAIMITVFCIYPVFGLFGPWTMRAASFVVFAAAFALYRDCGRRFHGISAAYAFLLPVAACLIIYALLRSVFLTLVRQGVVWRGTFYPLAELRKNAGPLR